MHMEPLEQRVLLTLVGVDFLDQNVTPTNWEERFLT
jgi:hypothetical protein